MAAGSPRRPADCAFHWQVELRLLYLNCQSKYCRQFCDITQARPNRGLLYEGERGLTHDASYDELCLISY